jgi:hypothetical protein
MLVTTYEYNTQPKTERSKFQSSSLSGLSDTETVYAVAQSTGFEAPPPGQILEVLSSTVEV